jgi:hypothetical protein
MMFAASYKTGEVMSRSMADGTKQVLATLRHPICMVADAGYVYVRVADGASLERIDAVTRQRVTLANNLGDYSTQIALDGDWLYFIDWHGGLGVQNADGSKGKHDELRRVRRDGSARSELVAGGLSEPTAFVIGAKAIYISDRGVDRIVRIAKP